jgi:hypothetical protein
MFYTKKTIYRALSISFISLSLASSSFASNLEVYNIEDLTQGSVPAQRMPNKRIFRQHFEDYAKESIASATINGIFAGISSAFGPITAITSGRGFIGAVTFGLINITGHTASHGVFKEKIGKWGDDRDPVFKKRTPILSTLGSVVGSVGGLCLGLSTGHFFTLPAFIGAGSGLGSFVGDMTELTLRTATHHGVRGLVTLASAAWKTTKKAVLPVVTDEMVRQAGPHLMKLNTLSQKKFGRPAHVEEMTDYLQRKMYTGPYQANKILKKLMLA